MSKRGLSQKSLAESVGEYPQTLNAILKGKRKMPLALSLKVEKELGLEEGLLSVLQTYFEIEEAKLKSSKKPNLNIITKGLFWDIDFEKINCDKHSDFVISRTFERGNEEEKNEIVRFYGSKRIEKSLSATKRKVMKLHKNLPSDAVL